MSTTALPSNHTIAGPITAGLCSSLVGIGLARFAYTPLIPPLVTEHWFTAPQAAYLGAANLMGYVIGAVASLNLTRAVPTTVLLRAMMLVVAASFFASGFPQPFPWFFAWRFAAGFAGGVLMVVGMSAALEQIPASRRGVAAGIAIGGVGTGIIASGTLVPILLTYGLGQTWLGLGALSLVLTAISWPLWPRQHRAPARSRAATARGFGGDRRLWPVYAAALLTALGLVPSFIFAVDFIARGLHRGIAAGAHLWIVTGCSALFGTALIGHVGDRIGFKKTLRWSYAVQAAAVGLFAFAEDDRILLLASVVVGAYIPAIVPLVLGRIQELIPDDATAQRSAWRTATAGFGIGQAAAGYAYAFIFSRSGGDYRLLFLLGALSFVVGLGLDLYAGRSTQHVDAGVRS